MQPGALRGVDLSFENVFHLSQFSRDVSHKLPGGLKTTNVAGTYFKLISGYAILQNCTDVTTASSEGSDMRTKHVLQIKKIKKKMPTIAWFIIRLCTNKIALKFALLKQHIKMIVLF